MNLHAVSRGIRIDGFGLRLFGGEGKGCVLHPLLDKITNLWVAGCGCSWVAVERLATPNVAGWESWMASISLHIGDQTFLRLGVRLFSVTKIV